MKTTTTTYKVFPFSALIGQQRMKLALMLNAVNPAIGGVLIRGEKGTAKSTAVRGLAKLLPSIEVVDGCAFQCDPESEYKCLSCIESTISEKNLPVRSIPAPFVNLPLGATEDMVLGAIDFEAAVKSGTAQFMPGLLARANRGIVYVDEVNLLDDHLVDAILDSAETGVNVVEREGLSVRHPSRFMLVGTMNPEEGELRPQILDRFGLAVQVEAESDPGLRVELLRRREQFDLNPEAFIERFTADSAKISEQICNARSLLPGVFTPKHLLTFIAEICAQNNVAGHRADLAIERAACAYAVLNGKTEVSSDDIISVAPLALLHRMRTAQQPQIPPPPPPPPPEDEKDNKEQDQDQSQQENETPQQQVEAEQPPPQNGEQDNQTQSEQNPMDAQPEQQSPKKENSSTQEEVHQIGEPFKVKKFTSEKDKVLRSGSGRRSRTRSATKQGRYVKSTARRERNDLALDATLRAAAPYQLHRKTEAPERNVSVHIMESDIREKVRERRVGNVLVFLVDGSGSMGAQRRMVETKAAIMSLLLDAYQKRDKVCMIIFRGEEAQIVLPPTGSVDMAGKLLAELPIGGRTPLTAGLLKTSEVLEKILRKSPTARPLVLVVTDGKANAGLGDGAPHQEAIAAAARVKDRFENVRFAVIDTEPPGVVRFQLARQLASALQAEYFHPETLRAEDLVKIAKEG